MRTVEKIHKNSFVETKKENNTLSLKSDELESENDFECSFE